jgi:aldehyde dehydrogenase (NAD+)
VVLDDADLDAAVFGSFGHAGQVCMIANRLVVDLAVYDEFVAAFTERVRDLRVGDPADPSTDIGPVINSRQLSSVLDKVERAVSAGAKQVLGGEPSGPAGLLLPPHVLLGGNDLPTAREEVFGPVITVIPAAGEADALAIANDTEYDLSSAVFTRDAERGEGVGHRPLRRPVGDRGVHHRPLGQRATRTALVPDPLLPRN